MLFRILLLAPLALFGCTDSGGGNGNKNNGDNQDDPTGETDETGETETTDVGEDADGDGLNAAEEAKFGTDPDVADTDEDGLDDGEEFELGTDGTEADSDGDGYSDGAEVAEETDPADSDSRIYVGYWPYNMDKDAIEDPGYEDRAKEGETFARFTGPDQFQDVVDIYDFAYQGKPIIVDLSGIWCYYCNEMAAWLEGDPSIWDDYRSSYDWVDGIPEMIENGDIYWITILDQDANYGTVGNRDLQQWYNAYPNPAIPILADEEQVMAAYTNVYGYPTVLVIGEDMTIENYNRRDYTSALQYVWDEYGN